MNKKFFKPNWRHDITMLLKVHGRVSAVAKAGRHRTLSNRTLQRRREELFGCWRDLGKLGMQPKRAKNLGERHIARLVAYWEEKGLTAGTIQDRLTTLRTFAGWIGKPGMVKAAKYYLQDPANARRHYIATIDKSWTPNGVIPTHVIEQVIAHDVFVGHQLLAIAAFSLRRKESVLFHPWRVDQGHCLLISDGTKGGRARLVPIDDEQRAVLERLKQFVGNNRDATLANPALTLEQALKRFDNVMAKFGITKAEAGVTAHGLRHEGANDIFREVAGVESPVRGGDWLSVDPRKVLLARAAVTEALGHSAASKASAYCGSFNRNREVAKPAQPGAPAATASGA